MAKMTKAQAIRRLREAKAKVERVFMETEFLTLTQAAAVTTALDKAITTVSRK